MDISTAIDSALEIHAYSHSETLKTGIEETLLGSNGLIRKTKFVRVITQSPTSLLETVRDETKY